MPAPTIDIGGYQSPPIRSEEEQECSRLKQMLGSFFRRARKNGYEGGLEPLVDKILTAPEYTGTFVGVRADPTLRPLLERYRERDDRTNTDFLPWKDPKYQRLAFLNLVGEVEARVIKGSAYGSKDKRRKESQPLSITQALF